MKTFFDLVLREFKLFRSNSVLILLFIGAPLTYGILFGYTYKKGKVTDLPIVVVDEDHSSVSSRMIDMLDDNEVVKIAAILPSANRIKDFSIKHEAACILIIPSNFEADIQYKRYPEMLVYVNADNILTANFASRAIQTVAGTLKAGIQIEALKKTGVPQSLAEKQYEPFAATILRNYNKGSNYMYFLWPGMLATILQQVLFLALAITFAAEYEKNTMTDLALKAGSPLLAIITKCTPYFLMSFLIWLSYGLMHMWFKIPMQYNMGLLTLLAGLFVFAVSMMGILVSILIPNQLKATEILMVVATPSFVISGFTWPLSQMPIGVRILADAIPLTHFLQIYRILMVENGTFDLVQKPVLYLAGLSIFFGLLAWIALSRKFRKLRQIKEQ
ncbi:ABC-2 type transport system permease protein [Arcticibacter tournemirensis]|uniref:ABC transporter permease n=1 Tax=Arcticibacter tournemirensis TaxID=699437 RepID=A0A4Q0M2U3_9SPHI|nr:ABC transporter permease [Arcticibacter tournemirensis]KAA8479969.1 ABC transporter permease [Arcticibacter tournemirensis]RXF67033.1 ABC transporter permease [Arcticibacter tournemirensis]TQM51566.1 ABC-2 type transport system permease protein [Arcticibacter tournemirensis]